MGKVAATAKGENVAPRAFPNTPLIPKAARPAPTSFGIGPTNAGCPGSFCGRTALRCLYSSPAPGTAPANVAAPCAGSCHYKIS